MNFSPQSLDDKIIRLLTGRGCGWTLFCGERDASRFRSGSCGEQHTDGYTTIDLKGRYDITRGLSLQLGINNIRYVNHLNANNPFSGIMMAEYSGQHIPEPSRVIFFDLSYAF